MTRRRWSQRDLFVTGPGCGSNRGKARCIQTPEKSVRPSVQMTSQEPGGIALGRSLRRFRLLSAGPHVFCGGV
jgi:hypothetical protein